MTFDSKLLLRVDIKNKLFSFLFNNLPPLSCFAYSKASKVGNACGRRQSKDKAKNSEVLKRVNSDQGLLSTYEFLCVRFKSLVLQRSSTFEAFEYAKREKGQTWAGLSIRRSGHGEFSMMKRTGNEVSGGNQGTPWLPGARVMRTPFHRCLSAFLRGFRF